MSKKQPEVKPMTKEEIDQMFKRAEEKRLEALRRFYNSARR